MAMTGYTKLFNSILASTIWREDDKTRLVWITLLAMTDKSGAVEASIPGLADLARVSIEDCERALENLQKPDKYSRSKDHDGRRIETTDGGWLVLNRAKYRDKMSKDDKRERDRDRQRRHRQGQTVTPSVTHECDMSRMSRQTETETETSKTSSSEQKACSDVEVHLPKKPKSEPSREATGLALLLKTEILRNKADYKITEARERSWAVTADRMLRRDGRKPEEAADLIKWAQRDEFWMANVLSMDTLREKFDQLALRKSQQPRSGRNGKGNHSGAPQPMDYTLTPDEAARRAGLEAARTAGARN